MAESGSEIYKMVGIISGVGVVLGLFIYRFVVFAIGKIYSFLENEIKELKDVIKDVDMIHTKTSDNLYRKIDKINETCKDRGQQIGEIKGRLNGKD